MEQTLGDSPITVQELAACLSKINEKISNIKADLEIQTRDKMRVEHELLKEMEKTGISKFSLDGVGTIFQRETMSVKTPKAPEEKEAFFQYLKNIGEYDALITVNSQSLNSWFRMKQEAAKERGEVFSPPGLELPTTFKQISIRKG